ncbi:protector from prophage-induced early lysis [uncultured phage cr116_1]|uniref:Protector from prophage-induced early lysis n=1 Tax=uncultured phage cr116_1 TaxID=2772073 RepID=A0A7M1RYJ7_9CAUD|nr:VOG4590 [uncultured phage cr116_1]QOR59366.1 protector from prophage-induced early lysis [uncultured phage cr116_1]DAK53085.1 MAG TPA: hypothetical protein [Crassvirales sp.]
MQKVIKVDNKVTVFLENGEIVEKEVTEDEFKKVVKAQTDEEVLNLLCPEYQKSIELHNNALTLIEKIQKSKLLSMKGDVVYWKEVSCLSVPEELVKAIIKAEEEHNELKISTYRNFWTLMSLNPDERCRKNLFWFLQKYGMTISRCGFFVGYRNVDKTEEENVFTDHHSHTFKIKIGNMVTMDRNKCDTVQENTCSSGLHIGGKGWLKKNYYGDTGLACLINPADVVAVPPYDNYGKLRTCAYLPMDIIHYDKNDNVIPLDVEDGFDCSYVTKVIYEGTMGTKEDSTYKINIPEIPGTTVESIQDKLLEIAKECIVCREL